VALAGLVPRREPSWGPWLRGASTPLAPAARGRRAGAPTLFLPARLTFDRPLPPRQATRSPTSARPPRSCCTCRSAPRSPTPRPPTSPLLLCVTNTRPPPGSASARPPVRPAPRPPRPRRSGCPRPYSGRSRGTRRRARRRGRRRTRSTRHAAAVARALPRLLPLAAAAAAAAAAAGATRTAGGRFTATSAAPGDAARSRAARDSTAARQRLPLQLPKPFPSLIHNPRRPPRGSSRGNATPPARARRRRRQPNSLRPTGAPCVPPSPAGRPRAPAPRPFPPPVLLCLSNAPPRPRAAPHRAAPRHAPRGRAPPQPQPQPQPHITAGRSMVLEQDSSFPHPSRRARRATLETALPPAAGRGPFSRAPPLALRGPRLATRRSCPVVARAPPARGARRLPAIAAPAARRRVALSGLPFCFPPRAGPPITFISSVALPSLFAPFLLGICAFGGQVWTQHRQRAANPQQRPRPEPPAAAAAARGGTRHTLRRRHRAPARRSARSGGGGRPGAARAPRGRQAAAPFERLGAGVKPMRSLCHFDHTPRAMSSPLLPQRNHPGPWGCGQPPSNRAAPQMRAATAVSLTVQSLFPRRLGIDRCLTGAGQAPGPCK
jgi:hypothetical protein